MISIKTSKIGLGKHLASQKRNRVARAISSLAVCSICGMDKRSSVASLNEV